VLVADQTEVIDFLARPETYGGDGTPVRRVETHVSQIFLVGDRAYKLKRAVQFPYMDFSTADLRREACLAEVAVNRRTATDLYRDVMAIVRYEDGSLALGQDGSLALGQDGSLALGQDGSLALGDDGEAIDWLVVMNRFDETTLFDRMAARGALDRRLMETTAAVIAVFHQSADVHGEFGGATGIEGIIESNAVCFAESGEGVLAPTAIERLNDECQAALAAQASILDSRRDAGLVRHCHGDLHLRNIFLDGDRPTLFDGIEFNPALANIDVFYDLAFLLMDLGHRGLRPLANILLNRYLDLTGDVGGLAPLPLFMAMRAAVRSHVGATASATVEDAIAAIRERAEAREYLGLALYHLQASPPCLVAIGGLSGSGKSRLARVMAPDLGTAPGARVVRSDMTRKRLAGVDPTTRLGAGSYTPDTTSRVYDAVGEEVHRILASGHSAIADAVFADPDERRMIEEIARDAGVPFTGLWLSAPRGIMAARVEGRRGDASDATPDVLDRQLAYDLGDVSWRLVDSGGDRDTTLRQAKSAIAAGEPCAAAKT